VAAVVVAAALTTGCSTTSSSCWSTALSTEVASDAAPSAQAAIDGLVAEQRIEGLPATGWTGPADGGTFVSGGYELTVVKQPDGRFVVSRAGACT
jgi:hypothetical protein